MATLDELVYYCNEEEPIGALMLTGEYGCGKTYLIEKELTDALADTHIIVRVSLFGLDSADALNRAVRQNWFEACIPVLGSMQKAKDKGFFSAFSAILNKINPIAGGAADVMVSMDVIDLFTIKPEVEDFKTHKKKKVILVYDDLERVRMNATELMGVINDYCENQKFNSIISVNEESIREEFRTNRITYHLLREKTVSQTLHHIPDYDAVIHAIINKEAWHTEEYSAYLSEREDLIREVFISDTKNPGMAYLTEQDRRYHNFRTLAKGLQSFYRIYYHMLELGYDVPDHHLYSFLAYYLVTKSGICRGGKPCIECTDDDIKEFYTNYSPDHLTEAECFWVTTGIWDIDAFEEELKSII